MLNIQKAVYPMLVAFVLAFFIVGCTTVRVDSKVIEKPSEAIKRIRVLYVQNQFSSKPLFGSVSMDSSESMLYQLGYFGIGEKLKNIAPPLFAKYGVTADVIVMDADEFRGGGWRNTITPDKGAADIPLKLLTLQFTHGKGSNYGGVNLDLEIEASLTDIPSHKTHWQGTYDTRPRKTPFRNSTYDDAFLTEMLQMMLDDMVKIEVLRIDK